METLEANYKRVCRERSDIHEHCPTLARYAAQCASVTEAGVRSAVSSWALLYGLTQSSAPYKRHTAIDIENHPNIARVASIARQVDVEYNFLRGSDLEVPFDETDLFFIDTWHVYGQMKRELARCAPLTQRFIIMHDTVVDAIHGETIRSKQNADAQAAVSGIPKGEILRGLQPAIDEFLAEHKDWRVLEHFTNNNGLTVLERERV